MMKVKKICNILSNIENEIKRYINFEKSALQIIELEILKNFMEIVRACRERVP